METAPSFIEVKQEAEAAGSSAGAFYPQPKFSTSVTTGQGGPYNQSWPGKGVGLGNNRAPIPTCGISVTRGGPSITMVASRTADQRPISAQVADAIMGSAEAGAQPISSASLESTQEGAHLLLPSEEGSFQQSEDSDMASDEEGTGHGPEEGVAPIVERRSKPARKGKEKRKVGRPIAYKGDPNAPDLTEQERRRIKRRIANRESARRVRHKRQEILEEMQAKMEQLQAQNCELVRRAQEAEGLKQQLCSQMAALEGRYEHTSEVNSQMQQEIDALRQSLQVKMSALEAELDKCASEVDNPSASSAFSMQALQPLADCSASRSRPGAAQPRFTPTEGGVGLDMKGPLEWLPSLNLDDMPARAESWDMLNSLLREETGPTMSGEAVC